MKKRSGGGGGFARLRQEGKGKEDLKTDKFQVSVSGRQ